MPDAALARFEDLFGPEFGHGRALDAQQLRRALGALGDPQDKLPPVIHVAGTNGKGSTIAFMRAIAEAAGLSAHVFSKPHLFLLRERFVIAGAEADDDALIAAAARLAAVSSELTQFDAQVGAAFLLFSETPADLALIETGMGGREDSTNVIAHPALSVLAPIGLDHQDALGASLEEIAAHKAGILKPAAPAVIARQAPAAMAVIEARAAEIGAPLWRHGVEWDAYAQHGRLVVQSQMEALDLPLPGLTGAHQIDNAGLAVAALMRGDWAIPQSAFEAGLKNVRWPGRLQALTRGALAARAGTAELWLDGGHNAHAAAALSRALAEMARKRPAKTAIIVGLRARKDWRGFVEALAPVADIVVALPLSEAHAAPVEIAGAIGAKALTADSLENAIDAALARGAERILICGSLLLVASALGA